MDFFFCALIGLFIGSLNPAWLLSRARGFDIRDAGSGNAGASNAVIVFGKLTGALCALLDVAKACLAILLARTLFPAFPWAFALTGACCVIGHIFSVFMRLRGGKGFACMAGVALSFDWRVFLAFLAVAVLVALVTDYICFVPTAGSLLFTAVYGALRRDLLGALFLLAASCAILARHLENFRRIRLGTELRFSYLWRGQKEIDRVRQNAETQLGAPLEGNRVPPAR